MWIFADKTSWIADDQGCQFTLVSIDGTPVAEAGGLPFHLLAAARLHPSLEAGGCPADRASTLFPAEFAFCPSCGVELVESEPSARPPWFPPFGNLENARLNDFVLERPDELSRHPAKAVGLPFNTGRLRFVGAKMGGAACLLFAIDLRDGLLAVYNPPTENWLELSSPLQSSGLPDWAWTASLSSSERYVVMPDRDGVHVMRAVWSKPGWVAEHSFRGRCLAGPGVLSDAAPGKHQLASDLMCVPVEAEGGNLVLAWWSEGVSSAWSSVPLPAEMPRDAVLGLPVRPRRRSLVWPGRQGLLTVTVQHEASAPKTHWKPWPAAPGRQVEGLPELGPCWRDQANLLWQVCEERGGGRRGEDINIKRVRLDDVSDSQLLPYGDILTTGRACFSRYHDHWRSPDEYVDTEPDRRTIRLPLLQFHVRSSSGIQPGWVLLAHMQCPDGTEDIDLSHVLTHSRGLRGRMHLELAGPGIPPIPLNIPGEEPGSCSIGMEAFTSIQACIYDHHLWVLLPQPDRLLRWPLPRQ